MKKRNYVVLGLALVALIVITCAVTYAFFNYAQAGSTDNSITTGTITFIYEEVEQNGAGISITDAFPMTDEAGKALTGAGKVFNFTIKSVNSTSNSIPYEVTARKSLDSDLAEEAVYLYLTEVEGTNETEKLFDLYSNLTQTSLNVPAGTVEKTIYSDTVAASNTNYEKDFRLRMWIPNDIEFYTKDTNGNDVYGYNDKSFKITVNVYAEAEVVTQGN